MRNKFGLFTRISVAINLIEFSNLLIIHKDINQSYCLSLFRCMSLSIPNENTDQDTSGEFKN